MIEMNRWFDADSIIINPKIPLEIFLPPPDQANEYSHIHFIGNKDFKGLNTGTFFLRVHEWSVKMLVKTIGFPIFRPDVDLGFSVDQNAMAIIFNETDFRSSVLFQPRTWFNTYQFHHGYEGAKGNLLVHFPGLEDARWRLMEEWLDVIENHPENWSVEVGETMYPKEIQNYWDTLGRTREWLRKGEEVGEGLQRSLEHEGEEHREGGNEVTQAKYDELGKAMERLTFVMQTETDRLEAVREAQEELEKVVGKVTNAASNAPQPPPPPPPPPAS